MSVEKKLMVSITATELDDLVCGVSVARRLLDEDVSKFRLDQIRQSARILQMVLGLSCFNKFSDLESVAQLNHELEEALKHQEKTIKKSCYPWDWRKLRGI